MCQAKIGDILEKNYVPPEKGSEGYSIYKTKDTFLKNHLLTATMSSHAAPFINVRTMSGIEMYNKLLNVFQGLEHEEDTALGASATWEKLKFN